MADERDNPAPQSGKMASPGGLLRELLLKCSNQHKLCYGLRGKSEALNSGESTAYFKRFALWSNEECALSSLQGVLQTIF